MGFNTLVMILNDRFSELENNPERLIADIRIAMNDPDHYCIAQTTVFPSQHADHPQIMFSQANWASDMCPHSPQLKADIAKNAHVRSLIHRRAELMRDWADQIIEMCDDFEDSIE